MNTYEKKEIAFEIAAARAEKRYGLLRIQPEHCKNALDTIINMLIPGFGDVLIYRMINQVIPAVSRKDSTLDNLLTTVNRLGCFTIAEATKYGLYYGAVKFFT